MITRRVTDTLNLIGATAMAAGWSLKAAYRDAADGSTLLGLRASRLAASSVLLAVLFVLHRVMDHRLDAGELAHFYALHRAYLWTSTIQWLVNLTLLIGSSR